MTLRYTRVFEIGHSRTLQDLKGSTQIQSHISTVDPPRYHGSNSARSIGAPPHGKFLLVGNIELDSISESE